MPKNINTKTKRGFTIIEVVLVLAVAGLIFLMVFIALPALQRSQRDTQRRNDYGMLSAAITSYSASNGGKLYKLAGASGANSNIGSCRQLNPATYINAEGTDPDGYHYQLVACNWSGFEASVGTDVKLTNKGAIDKGDFSGDTNDNSWFNDEYQANDLDADGSTVAGTQVYVVIGADCDAEYNGYAVPNKNTSSRSFVVFGFLESGSQTYCNASQ